MNIELLRAFCSTDETRPALQRPFNLGEYSYATDGRILIRVARLEEVPPREGESPVGNPDAVIPEGHGYEPAICPPKWEEFKEVRSTCKRCDGTGKSNTCPDCDGEGEIECPECLHEHECERCHGQGIIKAKDPATGDPCENCDGTGYNEDDFVVALNGGMTFVNLKYLRLAHRLPNLKMSFRDRLSTIRLEFDGGVGALMPMNLSAGDKANIAVQWPTPA